MLEDEVKDRVAPAEVVRKEKGFAHFLSAARYSYQGFRRLLGEAAFRQELAFFLLVMVLFWLTGAEVFEYMIFAMLALLLFAVEALNTAIEEVVDRVSPEFSLAARHAKDLGSFAVLCMLAANGVFVGYVLIF